MTETCDDDTPHGIPHGETTLATAQEVPGVETIHQALAPPHRLPEVHFVDGADTSGAKLARSQRD